MRLRLPTLISHASARTDAESVVSASCLSSISSAGRNEEALRSAAEKIGAKWIVWDVADISVMQENFDKCVSMLDGFDTLVSNAGVLTPQHEWGIGMLDLTEDEWDTVMDINLKGAYFMMHSAVK